MKVLFTFSGLPHYLVALLNKLVSAHAMDVSVVIPGRRGISLGEGIKLDEAKEDHLFSVYQLDEYRARLNKPYFRGMPDMVDHLKPDILVIGWPYIINYSLDSGIRRIIRKNHTSVVYREIPFMVAPKNKAMSYYRKSPVLNENMEVDNPVGPLFYPWAIGLNHIRKRYYRLVDATLIYASHGYKIHESFGLSRDRIFLTYNTPDTDQIYKTQEKLIKQGVSVSDPGKILHLGRLIKWKRVDLLIDAVSQLPARHNNLELTIIGAGPEEEHLKRLARLKAPEGRIKFLGAIYDPETLAKEILSSSVYVLGGMGGLSINEAMAYGKAVVCSRCDGTERDLITDGVSGLFFEEGDADDLASKIELLLDDPHKIKVMGENARRIIQEKVNLNTVTQRFADCFEHLMRTKDGG